VASGQASATSAARYARTAIGGNCEKEKLIVPTFSTLLPQPPPIPPGVHLGKIVKASERTSANGNEMIVMTIQLPPPGSQRLPCVLTFCEQARRPIDAFCSSAGLIRPLEPDIEVELRAAHCLNRYIFFKVALGESDEPKIVRFLDREAALLINPAIAQIPIQPQAPVALPVVRKTSL
jgi:hypothetical protein